MIGSQPRDGLMPSRVQAPPAAPATSAQVAAWAVLSIALLCLSLRGWGTFQVGVYQDDAHYLILARALAGGGPYGLINEPGPPPTPKHPFAFPLLLAPVVGFFPQELLVGAAVSLVATLANVSLLFWGWPRLSPSTSRWWGLGVASLYSLSPMAMNQTRVGLTEPTFLSFVLAGLLMVETRGGKPRGALSVALGVLLTFAVFTRWLGLSVSAAVLLRLGFAGRGARASLAGVVGGSLVSLALILAFTSIEMQHLLPMRYLAEFAGEARPAEEARPAGAVRPPRETVPERFRRVAAGYAFSDLRQVLLPIGGGLREQAFAESVGLPFLPQLIAVVLAGLVALGMWHSWRTRALSGSAHLYELLYFGALILWPWHSGRFLYPVQPFLALQLLLGVRAMGDALWRLRKGPQARARFPVEVVGAWSALLALSLLKGATVVDTRAVTRDLRVGTAWLAENSPPDAIVMARYPQSIHLHSARRTVPLSPGSYAEFEDALDRVDFVLIGPELVWREDGVLAYDRLQVQVLRALDRLAREGRVVEVYQSSPRELVRVFRVEKERP